MSCDKFNLDNKFFQEVKNKAFRTYSLALGSFVGKFIGELIDKLRAEEEARSELEGEVLELRKIVENLNQGGYSSEER